MDGGFSKGIYSKSSDLVKFLKTQNHDRMQKYKEEGIIRMKQTEERKNKLNELIKFASELPFVDQKSVTKTPNVILKE